MAKFQMKETIASQEVVTTRFAEGTDTANGTPATLVSNNHDATTGKELGKAMKMLGDSRYGLCAAGDAIEAFAVTVEPATLDGYTFGSAMLGDRKEVTFDGLQATAGTGVIAIGDYVVAGTVVAKGTALSAPVKVCKATNQPGVAVVSTVGGADTAAAVKVVLDAALVKVADAQKNAVFAWRVVSLGSAGTGAVGTTGTIERVSA